MECRMSVSAGWQAIRPDRTRLRVAPNLADYDECRRTFSWDETRARLIASGGDAGLNIANLAVDQHVRLGNGGQVAIRWLGKRGERLQLTYGGLSSATNRFANVLTHLGVGHGERVFVLLGRIPELYVAVLGALKRQNVVCSLFSAFGPEPIHQRMTIGEARVLVTTSLLYRRKVAPIREQLPGLRWVLATDIEAHDEMQGLLSLPALMREASEEFTVEPTAPGTPALLHFTSGTTGTPKGALHVHDAVVAHWATGLYALDFHAGDIFWCTADPGWVTGTSYGIISPLCHGLTMVVDEAEFDVGRWYQVLEQERVSVWYTAPTAIRMLMKAGTEAARQHEFPALRFIGSVGEPLNPEGVIWGVEAFGLPIHDNWWQTETGGIMIANFASMEIRPGSMGKPLPGIDAVVVRHEEGGRVTVIAEPGVEGELALRPGWPSMFREYLGQEDRYQKCFAGGWYLSGDLVTRDADGYYWFVGRGDDVIKSAGHLIGPFEVESALMEHRAVAEAGVIGKPDPVAGASVKAFVALKAGFEASDDLMLEILGFARARLGPAVAPREIAFLPSLPRTRSGKIMRRLLKARELGLPEGDLSTLEND